MHQIVYSRLLIHYSIAQRVRRKIDAMKTKARYKNSKKLYRKQEHCLADQPKVKLIGIIANASGTIMEKAMPVLLIKPQYLLFVTPNVRKALWKPCAR